MKALKTLLLTALIVLTLMMSVMTANGAGSYFLYDDFYYGVDDNGDAYVRGYAGDVWDIAISEKFLNYYVTRIDNYAFYENDVVEAPYFYDATELSAIGDYAFSRCSKLKKITITSSIQTLGKGAFDSCPSLSYVRFRADSAERIPEQCFYGCASLSSMSIENDLKSIGSLAFSGCSSLNLLDLPDSVNEIADNAFTGCDKLVLGCTYGSYTLGYARNHGIDYFIRNYLHGDFNCDGRVGIRDVTCIQLFTVGAGDISVTGKNSGDVDGNNKININDATMIQLYLAGAVENF